METTLILDRTELVQALTIIGNRLDEVRNTLLDTDYEKTYGLEMGGFVRTSDQQYANDLHNIFIKMCNILDKKETSNE
jgi:hypothetical protein